MVAYVVIVIIVIIVVVFVVVLSQKPSIKNLFKIGSVIDGMLCCVFVMYRHNGICDTF